VKRLIAGLLMLTGPAMAEPAAQEIRFVTCPIYRDADFGKKSGCWLANNHEDGVRYDVSPSPTKPDWHYAILVEGRVAKSQKDVCGGVVLDPARVSVLDEPCTPVMIPAEGFPGRKFVLPTRNMRPLYEPRAPFTQPYQVREFSVPFEFDRSFVTYQLGDYLIDQAVAYAVATKAAKVEIVGYAATDPASVSGRRLAEHAEVAQARAQTAAQWMTLLGVPADRLRVSWKRGAQPAPIEGADGLVEPSRRRVDIRITPGAGEAGAWVPTAKPRGKQLAPQ
jgi:outer membrane protein OmpA-like peptidoglycan-associated protein